jgi:hypothetical protein
MNRFQNIDWRTASIRCLRIALTGTSHALALSSRLLQASGTACEKLRALAHSQAERLNSAR